MIVSTTAPPPWVGAWAVARTVPSGQTSPAEIVEAPTSTPTIGSVGIVMPDRPGKRCASRETLSGGPPVAPRVQADLAGQGRRPGKASSELAARSASSHGGSAGERASPGCGAPVWRRPMWRHAVCPCASIVPSRQDRLRGQRVEIKRRRIARFPSPQARLASASANRPECPRAPRRARRLLGDRRVSQRQSCEQED